jgi:hypothetical protein
MSPYPIPKGWRRVTRGRTLKGDKAWKPDYWCSKRGRWVSRKRTDTPVDMLWCIIRRKRKAKTAGACAPRIHYYAKCVRILSAAQPWERLKVVKALCLLVGIDCLTTAKETRHAP